MGKSVCHRRRDLEEEHMKELRAEAWPSLRAQPVEATEELTEADEAEGGVTSSPGVKDGEQQPEPEKSDGSASPEKRTVPHAASETTPATTVSVEEHRIFIQL